MKKKLFIIIVCALSAMTTSASYKVDGMELAITHSQTYTLPFDLSKAESCPGYGLANDGYVIPDKMYEDLQLSKYYHAWDEVDAGMSMGIKFNIGNGMYLGLVDYGGVLENGGYSLVTVDQNYNVVDTLEAGVSYFGDGAMKIKQFRITDGKEVYVYQLVPTTTKSIPFESFRSVDAYLKCTIYRIDSVGKFVKISETRSENTRTLTRDELNDDTKNLWDWFQLKPATGVVTSVHP